MKFFLTDVKNLAHIKDAVDDLVMKLNHTSVVVETLQKKKKN